MLLGLEEALEESCLGVLIWKKMVAHPFVDDLTF